jgi:hypothetical protein
MNRSKSLLPRLTLLAVAAVTWVGSLGTAWAQTTTESAAQGGEPFVLPYAVVGFSILLGCLVVLASSRRRERAKPETYADRQKKAAPP